MGFSRGLLSISSACLLLLCGSLSAQDRPAGNPATASAQTKRVVEYLEREYKRKLETPDWRQRALAVVCLARLPHAEVTDRLLALCDSDKSDLVRLLAWESVLARVPDLTESQHQRFVKSTESLAEKGAFHGSLRVALLDVLATSPMNARSRKAFDRLATETNAWETQDIPTIRALGRCLSAWKNAPLADQLVTGLRDQNRAYRFDLILQAAGVGDKHARDHMPASVWDPMSDRRVHISSDEMWAAVQQEYTSWIQKHRSEWAESKVDPEAWRQLRPLYVPPPLTFDDFDRDPALWKPDLELGAANMKAFEVCFVVDATESMGEVLGWLSRDIRRMINALGIMSLEPRIGVTFYRDYDDVFVTRSLPLTGNAQQLQEFVSAMDADGGGDIPEAVVAGLREAYTKNRWSPRQDGGKILLLIGDAPPHPREVTECVSIVTEARKKGFKLYAAKVTTEFGANDLSVFDQLATLGGGSTVAVTFGRLSAVRFIDSRTKKQIPLQTMARPEAQFVIAPSPPEDAPGEQILEMIIADAVNPAYRTRLAPLVRTLLAAAEPVSAAEKRLPFPANTESLAKGELNVQGK